MCFSLLRVSLFVAFRVFLRHILDKGKLCLHVQNFQQSRSCFCRERFCSQAYGNWWERKIGRKTNSSPRTDRAAIPPSDSNEKEPHISQPAGWDCGQNIILFLVELNILDSSPGLTKDCGLLLSWCMYWTNQCRKIPSKATKYKDNINISGRSCCWRLGQYCWATSLPACPILTLFSEGIHFLLSKTNSGVTGGVLA